MDHEVLLNFFTMDIVAVLLLIIGFSAIFIESFAPGFGLFGLVGIISLVSFFVPQVMIGTATWWHAGLFVIGISLIILEVYVIPGTIISIISGICCILFPIAGIFTNWHSQNLLRELLKSVGYAAVIFVFVSIIVLMVLKYLPKSKYSSALILKKVLDSDAGYISESQKELINKTGEARTILRPAGKVMIENKLIDVVTQGEFIEAGTMVKVIATDNNRIIVKQIKA